MSKRNLYGESTNINPAKMATNTRIERTLYVLRRELVVSGNHLNTVQKIMDKMPEVGYGTVDPSSFSEDVMDVMETETFEEVILPLMRLYAALVNNDKKVGADESHEEPTNPHTQALIKLMEAAGKIGMLEGETQETLEDIETMTRDGNPLSVIMAALKEWYPDLAIDSIFNEVADLANIIADDQNGEAAGASHPLQKELLLQQQIGHLTAAGAAGSLELFSYLRALRFTPEAAEAAVVWFGSVNKKGDIWTGVDSIAETNSFMGHEDVVVVGALAQSIAENSIALKALNKR